LFICLGTFELIRDVKPTILYNSLFLTFINLILVEK